MLNIKTLTIIICFVLIPLLAMAQENDNRQNPPSLKWREINTKYFQLIYPEELEKQAQQTANIVDYIYSYVGNSIGKKPQPISIILQNQSVESNGFVTQVPRHSEFFTTPPQDSEPEDWINSLAIHELRHVVQIDKTIEGIDLPLIQSYQSLIVILIYPIWHIEGDAVVTETVLSNSGRGRLADWESNFKSNLLTVPQFSYSKSYLGSYNDFVPSYYNMGYYMSSKIRRDYGDSINKQIYSRSKQKLYYPWPYSSALKHYTGLTTNKLYHNTMLDIQKQWIALRDSAKSVNYESIVIRKNNTPTDYLLPQVINNDTLIYLKKGYSDVPALYFIDTNGVELKKITTLGPQEMPNFNANNRFIVWDETRKHPRYEAKSYSVLMIYDRFTNKKKQLTKKTRYFSPYISKDGKIIACVNVSIDNQFSIVLIDASNGKEIKKLDNPKNIFFQSPALNDDNSLVISTATSSAGRNIIIYNIENNTYNEVFEWNRFDSNNPSFINNNEILFSSDFTGTKNIYKYDIQKKDATQLTNSVFGVRYSSLNKGTNYVYFNKNEYKGVNISKLNLTDSLNVTKLDSLKSYFIDYYKPIVASEEGKSILEDDLIPDSAYQSNKYSKIKHLFNFHTLLPVFDSFENEDNKALGLSINSDNLLNTLSFNAGYAYNTLVKGSEYSASFTYSEYYPKFSVNYVNYKQLGSYDIIDNSGNIVGYNNFSWREQEIDIKVSVPYSFYNNGYNYWLEVYSGFGLLNRYALENVTTTEYNFTLPIKAGFSFQRQSRMARKDLYPKWGQNLSVDYYHSLDNFNEGKMFRILSTFFIPGLVKHHSFIVNLNYQNTEGYYLESNYINRASGSSFLKQTELNNSVFFKYKFPIAYPDWELGRLAYVKRIKGGFFADSENLGQDNGGLVSYGAELVADVNLLRIYTPGVEFGGRAIFFTEKHNHSPVGEIIFKFDF